MKKRRCITCGTPIRKTALYDPYMCRDCETLSYEDKVERYWYLDRVL